MQHQLAPLLTLIMNKHRYQTYFLFYQFQAKRNTRKKSNTGNSLPLLIQLTQDEKNQGVDDGIVEKVSHLNNLLTQALA